MYLYERGKNTSLVKDFIQFEGKSDEELHCLKVNGLNRKTLKYAINQSHHAMEGSRPTMLITNHAKATNPCKSLYGKLKEKILQTKVEQIFNNSKELFQGTFYENNWFFIITL